MSGRINQIFDSGGTQTCPQSNEGSKSVLHPSQGVTFVAHGQHLLSPMTPYLTQAMGRAETVNQNFRELEVGDFR